MTHVSTSGWAEPVENSQWRNWAGTHTFPVGQIVQPASEDEVVSVVQHAVAHKRTVRAAGSGHSFTPIVQTKDVLLEMSKVSGVVEANAKTQRATILAGTRIADIGAPLWDAGLALANQGDTDAQTISGAIATGTKGSGLNYGSISSMMRSARIVNGVGDVVDINEGDLDVLHAAQVSIGLLGVITRIELEVVPRYRLVEENRVMPFGELVEQWDDLLVDYRHFSFWWCPADSSYELYGLSEVPADSCLVKLLREARPDEATVAEGKDARTDRSHRIYPDVVASEASFDELEYMVPADTAKDVVQVMRRLQRDKFSDELSPLQIRWQKADHGFLSPQYGRDTASVSVSGIIGTSYEPFLQAVDRELQAFDARPHWGKTHRNLTAERVRSLYPRLEDFQDVRRKFDPDGLFLNTHLAQLFGN